MSLLTLCIFVFRLLVIISLAYVVAKYSLNEPYKQPLVEDMFWQLVIPAFLLFPIVDSIRAFSVLLKPGSRLVAWLSIGTLFICLCIALEAVFGYLLDVETHMVIDGDASLW